MKATLESWRAMPLEKRVWGRFRLQIIHWMNPRVTGNNIMKQSAGTLLYRGAGSDLEVLLVHPSGHYNRGKPWSIPKGLVDPGESSEETARRETLEETGVTAGELVSIATIDYKKSRKRIEAFVGLASDDAAPKCASWEVDCAEFVPLTRAYELIHPDQAPFLDRLVALLGR